MVYSYVTPEITETCRWSHLNWFLCLGHKAKGDRGPGEGGGSRHQVLSFENIYQ